MADTTWTQSAGMNSATESADNLLTFAERSETAATNAEASETAAAASAASALASKNLATTSETNAAASEAAAAVSETNAAASEAAALASQSAAATSATNAATSETNAATSESNASTSATNAATSETNAGTSETNAAASAAAASTSETNAAASAAAAAASETNLNLGAINDTIAATAVDVFVYDTSKDSDGGAWRKRTQHTSWYNETLNTATRGSRREFPAVAVIVATSSTVTIYDADDPALPMWMVFEVANDKALGSSSAPSSVAARNAKVSVGFSTTGVCLLDFVSDSSFRYHDSSAIQGPWLGYGLGERNTVVDYGLEVSPNLIVDRNVNDVAMTVLPDAPVDAATGLPVPTIAVATDGGVSVITDSGAVYDITYTSVTAIGFIHFTEDGKLFYTTDNNTSLQRFSHVRAIPTADVAEGAGSVKGTSEEYYNGNSPFNSPDLFYGLNASSGGTSKDIVDFEGSLAFGTDDGLRLVNRVQSSPASGLVAAMSSDYNTGWMNGDIKGAFLSSTDATSLVGSGELVDWNTGTVDPDFTILNATTLSFDGTQAQNDQATITSALTVGKSYVWTVTVTNYVQGSIAPYWNGTGAGTKLSANGTTVATYVATGTSIILQDREPTPFIGDVQVSVKLADADRSVNANGLVINGTVTRSAVATGAELVGYSGFSASNYLEQPYNADLDFGTGDFCVMGWVTYLGAGTNFIIDRQDGISSNTDRFNFFITSSTIGCRCDATLVSVSNTFTTGVRYFVAVARTGGVAYFYVNGELVGSAAQAGDVTDVSASYPLTVVANGQTKLDSPTDAALIRISATVPTAEQIKKIYEDEKVLFQENAACTLYGSSDAVTALAYDEVTDLLHVGTSAGRSDFSGLRRVSNTATAVTTAISAHNGLVSEQ